MDKTVRQLVTDLRRALAALYGPRLVRVVLFGSWARGDAEPDSDIDVLVVLKGAVSPGEEITRTGGIVADLSLRSNRVITPVFVAEERYLHSSGPLMHNIAREGAPI